MNNEPAEPQPKDELLLVDHTIAILNGRDQVLERLLDASAEAAVKAGLGEYLQRLRFRRAEHSEVWIARLFREVECLMYECDHQLPAALDSRVFQPKWVADPSKFTGKFVPIIESFAVAPEFIQHGKCDPAAMDHELNGTLTLTTLTKKRKKKNLRTPLIFAIFRELEIRRLRFRRDSPYPLAQRVQIHIYRLIHDPDYDQRCSPDVGILPKAIAANEAFRESIRCANALIAKLSDPPIPNAAKHFVDRLILLWSALNAAESLEAAELCMLNADAQTAANLALREMHKDLKNGKTGQEIRMETLDKNGRKYDTAFKKLLADSNDDVELVMAKLGKRAPHGLSASQFSAYFSTTTPRDLSNLKKHFKSFLARQESG